MPRSTMRRSILSVPIAVLAVLALATNALAAPPTWTAAQKVRRHNNISLDDAAFMARTASIAWTEPTSGAPRIGVKNFVEVGFGPAEFISASRNVAVDICGESLLTAAWERRVAPGEWRVVYSESSIDFNELHLGIEQVDPGSNDQMMPDVACTNPRHFVTWYEPEGDGARMFIANSKGTGWSSPMDLGLDNEIFFFNALAVAGAGSNAYAVFQRSDGDLRFKRFSIGAGPNFPVTAHATQVIANGNVNDPASYAVIDAAGSRVAVGWFRCDGLYARVSEDYGQTWKPIRKLIDAASCDGDFAASPNSIAVRGDRIAMAYSAASAFGGGWIGLFRTTTEFASFSDDQIWNGFQPEHLVGYMTFGGNVKLAAAFEKPGVIKFRRQQ